MIFVFETHEEEVLFYSIYNSLNRRVYNYALKKLKNVDDAEDAAQTVWLKISSNVYKLIDSGEGQRVNFVKIIARNTVIDIIKKNIKNSSADIDVETIDKADHTMDCFRLLEYNEIKRAIKMLDNTYKDPLVLKLIYGYDMKEIAALLNISERNVGIRVFRAKQKVCEIVLGGGKKK